MTVAHKIAGIGFRDGATLASIRDALALAGAADVTRLALPARKAGQPLCDALQAAGYDLTWVTDAALSAQATPTQSAIARKYYNTGCVPEAAALAALGPTARILTPRVISTDTLATAALATTGDPA